MLEALRTVIQSRVSGLKDQGFLKIVLANTLMVPDKLVHLKSSLQAEFPNIDLIYFPLSMSSVP